jgi:hypothetical protein
VGAASERNMAIGRGPNLLLTLGARDRERQDRFKKAPLVG